MGRKQRSAGTVQQPQADQTIGSTTAAAAMAATGVLDHVIRPGTAEKEEAFSLQKPAATDGAATNTSRQQQQQQAQHEPHKAALPTSSTATYIPGSEMPAGVERIVNTARLLFQVRTMQEHADLMQAALTRDVLWDAPPILMEGREDMRLCVYLAKSIAYLSLEPELINVYPIGFDRTIVELQATCLLAPKRSLLVPLSLLLPESLPIRATLKIGVKGPLDTGKIQLVWGGWHNLPFLPNFIRSLSAFAMGTLPRLTEPLWSWTLQFVGDDYYQRQQQQAAVAGSSSTTADGPGKKMT